MGRPDSVTGRDGRLTILLLGSDYRPAHPGNRTDTIMVVSVVPETGAVSALSIPRDTARFPLPGGGVYGPKINGLYQHYLARLGRRDKAAEAMKRTVGSALGVEIDSYVVTGFEGVRRLIDAVGGVDVTLARPVRDPYYWVNARTQGIYFPAGVNHLNGKRALIFARTRKGDNDFERARRQQQLVAAGVEAVRERGLARLPQLLVTAARFVRTDLPLVEAPRIFEIVANAKLGKARRVVLSPTRYATGIAGTYSYQLRLGVVRDLVARWFAPIPGSPAVPLPVPTPTVAPTPSPVHPGPESGS